MSCNPELSAMITDLIGDGWKKDANELEKLGNYVNDDAVLDRLLAVKAGKKADLKNYLNMKQGFDIDENQRTVVEGSTQIELTTKEFDLLMMFVNNRGKAFPREKILEQVWEENYFGSDRVVDDTLRRLRKKMPNLSIKTIYGFGYKLG